MKVLSLLQPWASLCVTIDPKTGSAYKRIETRYWNTKYRGELLIHASARMSKDQKSICYKHYFKELFEGIDEDLTLGAIIGKVTLVDTIKTEDLNLVLNGQDLRHLATDKVWTMSEQERAFGDYSPSRYGWLLSDPVLFKEPIPAKGQLNLWNYDGELPELK